MSGQKILLTYRGPVAVVTINRPQVYNALDAECWQGLRAAFESLDRDERVRVVILTGAGEKAFAAGADVNALVNRSVSETLFGDNSAVTLSLERLSKPTIAAINGLALGGGCELAMSCDLRIAAEHAKIGLTEGNVGILPGAGGTQRLTQLVGLGRATEMILTGATLKADEALSAGLVNRVVPQTEVMDAALALAEQLAARNPITARLAKLAIREGSKTDKATALLLETICQAVVFGTEDHREGLSAFLEKRAPIYHGH